MLQRALELDPSNIEARETLRQLLNGAASSHHSRDVSMVCFFYNSLNYYVESSIEAVFRHSAFLVSVTTV